MKKICAVLLVLSLSMSSFASLQVKAEIAEQEPEIQVVTIENEKKLSQLSTDLNEVDVIKTQGDTFEQLQLDDAKEVLDNGTDFLVMDAEKERMEELFETNIITDEEANGQQLACYVTSDNGEYTVLPIYVDVVYNVEDSISDEKYNADSESLYQHIKEIADKDFGIEYAKEIRNIQKQKSEDNLLMQLSEEELGNLQTSTLIGDSFCESGKFVYFYKEGTANGTGTDYTYSSASSKAGWSKMGSLSIDIYGIKIRTVENTTFDNIYSVVTATGLNDKYVKQVVIDLGVSELAANTILDETTSTGGATASNGKLVTSVSSSGAVTSGSYTTYAYNPNGQTVSTSFGGKYSKRWTFSPTTFVENKSYKVRPAITLKKTDGKNIAVTAYVSVASFQVSGGVRTYTIKDTVKCSIKFKNHTKV